MAEEYATQDFFEAAFLRSLGARLLRVDGASPGTAVLDVSEINAGTLADTAGRLARELSEATAGEVTADKLRRLYDNSCVGAMRGHFHVIRSRALRG
jgi:hypothetical protein